jgi:hypothetical protein
MTNKLPFVWFVYHVSRMSSPPRMLCLPVSQEKFGCKLNTVVVSLLRPARPIAW